MFCSHCGQQIVPLNANFCWSCGESLRAGVATPTRSAPSWETCRIDRSYIPDRIVPSLKAQVTFLAQVDAPTGGYTAARSQPFNINPSFSDPDFRPKIDDDGAQAAFKELVARLEQDGWQPIGDGDAWFNRLFRRQVR